MAGESLVGASLVGASLVGASLVGASLVGASLVGASLAVLSCIVFPGAESNGGSPVAVPPGAPGPSFFIIPAPAPALGAIPQLSSCCRKSSSGSSSTIE
ncbi:MAG: pentapeptide repeat-containing protein [Planctomycetota bacterium]